MPEFVKVGHGQVCEGVEKGGVAKNRGKSTDFLIFFSVLDK